MRLMYRAATVFALLSAAALQAQAPATAEKSWRINEAPSELRYAISRADTIVASLQDTHLRELTEALDRGGPAGAIRSCHIDVIGVIQRIGRQEGIAAGRTSDRLRLPTNAPKPWAAALVRENAGRQASSVEGFAVDLGKTVGVLRPIAHRPVCASCHGAADTFSPAVRDALRDSYPRDRATGFAVGEIRGWYWVEMPKTPGYSPEP